MRKPLLPLTSTGLVVLAAICMPQILRAQEGSKSVKSESVYRLEFTVREMEDGKRLNSRSYVMSLGDDSAGNIRVGNRVPYNTGKEQFQYFDVGINIDCYLKERENYVFLNHLGIEISSVVKDESTSAGTLNPVVRQARARVDAAVVPGKPTLVASLDDISSNRRYEVEVTATKVR